MTRRLALILIVLLVWSMPLAAQTITFDDRVPDRALTGDYPTGLVTWGDHWYLSGPWGGFATNSVSVDGTVLGASLTIAAPGWLASLQAYSGDSAPATITITCPGQLPVSRSLPGLTVVTVATGWTSPCGLVTVGTSNGWRTNFDTVVIGQPAPTTTLRWTQAAPDLQAAQTYGYRAYADGSVDGWWLIGVTCSGSVSPFSCGAPSPFVRGWHTVVLTTTNGNGESLPSNGITIVLPTGLPAAPVLR